MKNSGKLLILCFFVLVAFFSLSAASAATYTLYDEDDSYYYSNNAENYEVEFDSKSGSIWTENYKQVSSIKISDNKGKSKTLKNKIDFKNYKSKNGYSMYKTFYASNLGLSEIKKVTVNFLKQPDLKITKVKRKNNNYYITIKNTGDATAKGNYLGTYSKGKYIKKTYVPALKPGKYKTVKVSISSYYTKYNKIFNVDYKNKINELKKYNNKKTVKGIKIVKKTTPKKNSGGQVIITRTGTKYHAYKHGNMKYISYVSLSYARQYYGPCKICY